MNVTLPPGGTGLKITKRAHGKLVKLLRTFDNTKTVRELAPIAEGYEEMLHAIAGELASKYGALGPSTMMLLAASMRQQFWATVLHDRAVRAESPTDQNTIAIYSAKMADASAGNLMKAQTLAQKLGRDNSKLDPLAQFLDAEDEHNDRADPKDDDE